MLIWGATQLNSIKYYIVRFADFILLLQSNLNQMLVNFSPIYLNIVMCIVGIFAKIEVASSSICPGQH